MTWTEWLGVLLLMSPFVGLTYAISKIESLGFVITVWGASLLAVSAICSGLWLMGI